MLRDPLLYGLTGFANNNFARDSRDRKSVMRYCFFLNRVVVLWFSKKQRIVCISMTKAQYIALGHVTKKAVWIRQVINEVELKTVKNFTLYEDNEISMTLTINAKNQH